MKLPTPIHIWESQQPIDDFNSDEFTEIARKNLIVYHCLSMWKSGQLTQIGALVSAIKFLAIQNENMFKKLVEIYSERHIEDIQ